MKTTIDIPEPLYRKTKIRAIETGSTLKQIVLTSLTKELGVAAVSPVEGQSFMERRKLRPEFKRLMETDALGGGTDSAEIISEDRSSREDALL
ncbi:MAG TPA: hypothetical protein VJ952_09240 [Opitutales bacterium]|nr:hypothetical protein [Opitutales bacterium]